LTADWCHPPHPIENRGGWFDGEKTSAQIHGFSTYPSAVFSAWIKGSQPNGTIFNLNAQFWDGIEEYYGKQCDWNDCEVEGGAIELWITPCGSVRATFGDEDAASSEGTYTGGWTYITFRYTYEEANFESGTSGISVMLDGTEVFQFSSDYYIHPQWEPAFHVGSYHGYLYHWNGFIHSFDYRIETSISDVNFTSNCSGGACAFCQDFHNTAE
jgi:hypothetical protein